jgi:hypothetical protein
MASSKKSGRCCGSDRKDLPQEFVSYDEADTHFKMLEMRPFIDRLNCRKLQIPPSYSNGGMQSMASHSIASSSSPFVLFHPKTKCTGISRSEISGIGVQFIDK